MLDVAVIDDPAAAAVSLHPVRGRLLADLAEPGSASTLAARAGLSRQRVNYHLRALERHGLVELVEERRRGNCTERVLRATAASYVISPAAMGALAPDPDRCRDRGSVRRLLALAARTVRDVGALAVGAGPGRAEPATYALDTGLRFASAADRAAFTEKLNRTVTALAAEYHAGPAEQGCDHRLVIALHPHPEDRTAPPD